MLDISKSLGSESEKLKEGKEVDTLKESVPLGMDTDVESSVAFVGSNAGTAFL